ncbi:hypothetical protein B0H13DRAFT_1957360 [Mycena leptocephala]|nr:hypothetical protein B0H13DRAFT_1957360 [Mycena leptocephala]
MNPTNDLAVSDDASATTIHKLLVRLLVWVLLFAPACLSAALYIWEQHAPASVIFIFLTGYTIFFFALCITATIFRTRLSPRCRLVEPFAVYLVILINCSRVPIQSDVYPLAVAIWLGLVIPAVELRVWNWAVLEEGRKDRVIDLQYFKSLPAKIIKSTKLRLATMVGADYPSVHANAPSSPRMKPAYQIV